MDSEGMNENEKNAHKLEMTSLLEAQWQKGDTWYLIDTKWFRLWKNYFRYQNASSFPSQDVQYPGQIDNSSLFENPNSDSLKLKQHMLEEMDYALVPETAWKKLVQVFGLKNETHVVPRKVVESGLYVKQLSVEIYLLDLKLKSYDNETEVFNREYSKVTTVDILYADFRLLFGIPVEKEIRLYTDSLESLEKKDETLMDSGIRHSQTIIMQIKKEDGTWPSTSGMSIRSTSSISSSSGYKYSLRNGTNYMNGDESERGLCGLSNLGNTCFMNSALQCLSNVQSLTKYFLNDDHIQDLNKDNPLGMGGEIAMAYAKLIKDIWSGNHSSISPREFKKQVSLFAPQFSGYQQHDSQELLAFLIDGLHEDLNKIINKPYVELKDANGRPDEVVAEEAWKNHTKRNDSVIVDFFHGLFKSTLVCPEECCQKVSITFDPFCFLSLPLPVDTEVILPCLFVPSDHNKPISKHKIPVFKSKSMECFREALSKQTGVDADYLKVTDVYSSRFYKIFEDQHSLRSVSDKDSLYVYDMRIDGKMEKHNTAQVYLRRAESYGPKLVGHPFLIPLPENATYQTLYKAVLKALKRYIKEKHWEEVEMCEDWQKCEIIEENNSTGEPSDQSGDSDDDDNKGNKKSRQDPLFTLSITNHLGTTTIKTINDDNQPLKVKEGDVYFSADWETSAWNKYIEDDWEKKVESHESTKTITKKKVGIKLDACMKLFTQKEILGQHDLWYCPDCKEHKEASKKFDLWSLPPVLIIHLKRFSYSRWSRDKIDAMVDFPVNNLDMSDYVINPIKDKCPKEKYTYNLIAVSNHYGGLGGGHYTAYAKNSRTNKWHYFDDSSVSDAKESNVVTKAAYMLFYQRQDLEKYNSSGNSDQFANGEMATSPRGFLSPFSYHNHSANMNGTDVDNGLPMDTS